MLSQGDKQFVTEETESPVMRVKSIMMLLTIAIYEDLTIIKVIIASAFMWTHMVKANKYKWVHLDKLVVEILIERCPREFENMC